MQTAFTDKYFNREERWISFSKKNSNKNKKKNNFPPLIWQRLRDRQINRQRAGPWSACQLLRFCSAPVATTEPVPPARPLPLTPRARKDNVLDDIQISLTLDWKAQSPEGQAGQDNIIFSSSRSSARLWSANSGGWNLGNVKCHTENLYERSGFLFLTSIYVNSLYRERGGVFAHPPACAGMCSNLFALIFRGTSVKNSKQWDGYITLVSDRVQGAWT